MRPPIRVLMIRCQQCARGDDGRECHNELDPTPLRSAGVGPRWGTPVARCAAVGATSRPTAHKKAAISRAMATTSTGGFSQPAALSSPQRAEASLEPAPRDVAHSLGQSPRAGLDPQCLALGCPLRRTAFETYVERVLVPELKPGDLVISDMSAALRPS
jgi:hypothetical protein